MTIYVDTREKPHAIQKILKAFEQAGLEIIHRKLDVGDYMTSPDGMLSIDRKQNLGEVCKNLTWEKDRFERELRRAAARGTRMVVLVEHGRDVKCLEDVIRWKNPRLKESPKALTGTALYRRMVGFARRYNLDWRFCQKAHTGREIMRILGIRP